MGCWARTRTDIQAPTRMHTHTRSRAHMHTHTHTHAHARTHARAHTHTLSLSLSLSLTHTHPCTHARRLRRRCRLWGRSGCSAATWRPRSSTTGGLCRRAGRGGVVVVGGGAGAERGGCKRGAATARRGWEARATCSRAAFPCNAHDMAHPTPPRAPPSLLPSLPRPCPPTPRFARPCRASTTRTRPPAWRSWCLSCAAPTRRPTRCLWRSAACPSSARWGLDRVRVCVCCVCVRACVRACACVRLWLPIYRPTIETPPSLRVLVRPRTAPPLARPCPDPLAPPLRPAPGSCWATATLRWRPPCRRSLTSCLTLGGGRGLGGGCGERGLWGGGLWGDGVGVVGGKGLEWLGGTGDVALHDAPA